MAGAVLGTGANRPHIDFLFMTKALVLPLELAAIVG